MKKDIEIVRTHKFSRNYLVNTDPTHVRVTLDMPIMVWVKLEKTIQEESHDIRSKEK